MKLFLTLFAALCCLSAPVRAADTDYGTVHLINGWQMADGTHQSALVFDLNPGWKTYWRNPGPNGIPPAFNWLGSRNIGGVAISWPAPHLVGPDGAEALGYTGQVVIPIRFQPAASGDIAVALYLEFGVCSDICIPASLSLLATLDPAKTEGRAMIEAALQAVPHAAAGQDFAAYSCTIRPGAQGYDVATRLQLHHADRAALVVLEYDHPDSWIAGQATMTEGAVLTSSGQLRFQNAAGLVERSRLRLTVLANDRAFELRGCPAP